MVIDNDNNHSYVSISQGKDGKQNRRKKRKRKSDDDDNTGSGHALKDTHANGSTTKSVIPTTANKSNTTSTNSTIVENDSKYNVKQNYQPPQVQARIVNASSVPQNILRDTKKLYITINDSPIYHELLQNSYIGFSYVPASQVNMMIKMEPSVSSFDQQQQHDQNNVCNGNAIDFHSHYQKILRSLHEYYQYDIIMPGGKHSSRTFVRRTLVGEPGMTYKYLGLRLFTHAWRNSRSCDDATPASKKEVSALFHNVCMLNQAMIQMTENQVRIYQERTGKVVPKHLYDYNLTLINYMEPVNDVRVHNHTNNSVSSGVHHQQLRDEEFYNMGKASVSWHADSSLQDNSCIGVYHTLFHNTASMDIPTTASHKKAPTTTGGRSLLK